MHCTHMPDIQFIEFDTDLHIALVLRTYDTSYNNIHVGEKQINLILTPPSMGPKAFT